MKLDSGAPHGRGADGAALQPKPNGDKPLLDGAPKSVPQALNVRHLLELTAERDGNSRTRNGAFGRIIVAGQVPATRGQVISELREALSAGTPEAALALGILKAREAIEDLTRAAGETRCVRLPVKNNAITALGMLGEEAAEAAHVLLRALYDPLTRRAAAEALAKMGKTGASVLAEALAPEKSDSGVKLSVIKKLGDMGRQAESALPELERMTAWWHELNGDVRDAAREAIKKIESAKDPVKKS